MEFLQNVFRFLDSSMEEPTAYGWFHLVCLGIMIAATVVLCFLWKRGIIKDVKRVILVTAIIVGILELYKQINYTVNYEDGLSLYYQWYIFPWQFCTTPLYVGLLAGLSKGKIHHFFTSYLATYAAFAGLAVMLYPTDVFIETIGINIQTMICHGSMVVIAAFLYYTGYVKAEIKTLLRAIPLFAVAVGIAISLNELAYYVGILEEHTFNMFFINPRLDSTLPVYSLIHNALRGSSAGFVISVVLYIIGFTAVAFAMLAIPMGIKKFADTDFDARYAEQDKIQAELDADRREKKRLAEERLDAEYRALEEKRAKEREAKRAEKAAKKAAREQARIEKMTEKQLEKKRIADEKRHERELAKKKALKKRIKARLEKQKQRIENRNLRAEERRLHKEEEKKFLLGENFHQADDLPEDVVEDIINEVIEESAEA